MKRLLISIMFMSCFGGYAQNSTDSVVIRRIYDEALVNGTAYQNLYELCTGIGHRLSGSPQAAKAVEWGMEAMRKAGADTVYLQEVQVPVWIRGSKGQAEIEGSKKLKLHVSALGGSVGTGGKLSAGVVEVAGIEALKAMPREQIEGKIVFFNKPMDPRRINTFEAYGACVDQRYAGAGEAAAKGAVGVMVRSMSLTIDEHPHTGSMGYPETGARIPAMALSTQSAELLHRQLIGNPSLKVWMESDCEFKGYATSYNVIGEIRGNDTVMVVGGHLDSWDVGQGAHDDGSGCVQSIEVIRIFKSVGIKPRHTLRVILFMNEENGNMGGKTYAASELNKKEPHHFAMESDRGGFSPRGFHIDGEPAEISAIQAFRPLLEPYGLHTFEKGYSGVDIGPLKHGEKAPFSNILMLGLLPDSQRYFDFHHAETDVIENVHPRELHLGAAAMAAMIFLLDQK